MSSKFMRAGLAVTAAGFGVVGLAAQAKAAERCDRACLIKTTDQHLAALVAHDPSKAPLAANVVFVEDIKRMKPGEGLWKTATGGPTAFKIYVPDAALQQAGWLGVIKRDGKATLLALRLKVRDGKILIGSEIDAG